MVATTRSRLTPIRLLFVSFEWQVYRIGSAFNLGEEEAWPFLSGRSRRPGVSESASPSRGAMDGSGMEGNTMIVTGSPMSASVANICSMDPVRGLWGTNADSAGRRWCQTPWRIPSPTGMTPSSVVSARPASLFWRSDSRRSIYSKHHVGNTLEWIGFHLPVAAPFPLEPGVRLLGATA